MFTQGEFVYCINDRFHSSIVEWGDQFPKLGHVYQVKQVTLCRDALTDEPGYGLILRELDNPQNRLHFSAWRFRAVWPEVAVEQKADATSAPSTVEAVHSNQ